MVKVFLDIDIGDAARYAEELAAYQRAAAFLQECGSQYGLPSSLSDMDDEAQQLMQESYDSDPNWSSKGQQLWQQQLVHVPYPPAHHMDHLHLNWLVGCSEETPAFITQLKNTLLHATLTWQQVTPQQHLS